MNAVLYWNAVLLEASRRDFTRGFTSGQQPGPIRTSRAMAMVHLAIHDAVALRHKPAAAYLNKKAVAHGLATPLTGPVDDIIAGPAVTMLKAHYPKFAAEFDDSNQATNPVAFNEGVAVADALLLHRTGDGSETMLTGPQPINPAYGEHRADPYAPGQPQLGPVWGAVKRFTGAPHQALATFPHNGPTDYLGNGHYKMDYDEARNKGALARGSRTAEEQRIGVYWGYDGANNLGVPPRLYNQVARKIVAGLPTPLTLGKTAELFAMINVAMADGGIDCWHYKYVHKLWRPVAAIRHESAPDGDAFWAPLGMPQTNAPRGTLTPPFPAYPSGHATFGAALMQCLRLGLSTAPAALTLQDVLDVEQGTSAAIAKERFKFVSDELDGVSLDSDGSVRERIEHQFNNFAEPVWENSVSRIYLGVHWRFDGIPRAAADNIGGVPLDLAVGKEAFDFFNNGRSL